MQVFFLERGFSVIEIAALMSMLQITRIVGSFSWGWLSDYLSPIELALFDFALVSPQSFCYSSTF
ncbi:MFS transporter [Polynucleobacter necessarius]|uniref:MFS transporter n=1 Tax=Polynucleobacter necessarius TaxID=576610 RepID=UPI002F93F9C1